MSIVYLRIDVTEVVGLAGVTEVVGLAGVTEVVGLAGVTEVVGLAGVAEVVGLAGSPPAEDGCVQMLSSVTEDKLSEVYNGHIMAMVLPYHAGTNCYTHIHMSVVYSLIGATE